MMSMRPGNSSFLPFSMRLEKPVGVGSIPQPSSHLSGQYAQCLPERMAYLPCLCRQNDDPGRIRDLGPVHTAYQGGWRCGGKSGQTKPSLAAASCGGSTVEGENVEWPDFRRNSGAPATGLRRRGGTRKTGANFPRPVVDPREQTPGRRRSSLLDSRKIGSRRHRPGIVNRPEA
jgi:hypothetical protein